ncbi:unnamed protein product [Staurois parvus]|uniref:Uncharacterized protein n=1 Tax=Staurois parvus TaxID=386267 RepID=A0ABN9B837_9NEOB|nr:unnamed protein product [Staurois parvus]
MGPPTDPDPSGKARGPHELSVRPCLESILFNSLCYVRGLCVCPLGAVSI